ncbi:MAG: 4-hydroxy-tetrahydrodipicolinate reductase [Methanomassiliicoccales archaeon]|nr:MAG: 4-hydroxy-tetrahydrodipicolinate reductase [Methanomassiliicoccales archaeon]
MIRVVVAGATGKLGSLVCRLIEAQDDMCLAGAVVSANGGHVGKEIAPGVHAVGPDDIGALVKEADVFVDVTPASAAEVNLMRALPSGINCVIGSTGINEGAIKEVERLIAGKGSSAVLTANFSIGVNVFWKLCEQMARMLPDYEVEIIEVHHDKKKDAPSGTALKAARIISESTGVEKLLCGREGVVGARGREIGIHAVRIGDVVGEHTVIFGGNKERLELTHKAHSREAFAEGCITAVRWVHGKKDGKVHTMAEVLGL